MAEKIQLHVEGMSCGSCVNSIQTGVGALAGVAHVDVYLSAGLVDVTFDPTQTTLETISETIEMLGFDVK